MCETVAPIPLQLLTLNFRLTTFRFSTYRMQTTRQPSITDPNQLGIRSDTGVHVMIATVKAPPSMRMQLGKAPPQMLSLLGSDGAPVMMHAQEGVSFVPVKAAPPVSGPWQPPWKAPPAHLLGNAPDMRKPGQPAPPPGLPPSELIRRAAHWLSAPHPKEPPQRTDYHYQPSIFEPTPEPPADHDPIANEPSPWQGITGPTADAGTNPAPPAHAPLPQQTVPSAPVRAPPIPADMLPAANAMLLQHHATYVWRHLQPYRAPAELILREDGRLRFIAEEHRSDSGWHGNWTRDNKNELVIQGLSYAGVLGDVQHNLRLTPTDHSPGVLYCLTGKPIVIEHLHNSHMRSTGLGRETFPVLAGLNLDYLFM